MQTLTRQNLATDNGGFTFDNGDHASFGKMGDSYGRSVHALWSNGSVIGVVVKHPLKKSGEEGAYWFTAWTGPSATGDRQTFSSLSVAKKHAAHYGNMLSTMTTV